MTDEQLVELDRQTKWESMPPVMRATDIYQEILDQGQEAIPDLIMALRDKRAPIPVMMLLTDITGQSPVKPAQRGYVDQMIEAWLDWAEDNA